MAESRTRIGGSGWTTFSFRGTRLAWLQTLQDTAPAPVAQAQAVQPLDAQRPVEIVTARAVGPGTLRLTIFELWNANVWQQLPGLGNARNLLEIFQTQVGLGNISCRKIIRKPPPQAGFRTKNYIGCVITDVDDGETINIGTMTLPKGITIMYSNVSYI